MKKKGRLIFFIILSCCFFFLVYYVTYTYTYNDLQNNKLYDEEQLKPKTSGEAVVTPAIMQQNKMPVITDDNKELIVTAKTTYILEKHNKATGDFVKNILPVPIELMGMDYDDVQKYTLEKSAEEDGNVRLELVAFDKNLLVLRQISEYIEPDYMFFLVAEWGKVVVYRYYEESLYTKTNIKIVDLPVDMQEKIRKGMPVENERELFRFLESYSS